MLNRKLAMATIVSASMALSACEGGFSMPNISLPRVGGGGETAADRAARLSTERADDILRGVCFRHLFDAVPVATAATDVDAISVAAPGSRPSPLPETVYSFGDTPFLTFWGPRDGIGCSIGLFAGDLDTSLKNLINVMREEFGRDSSAAPNPFILLPVRPHEEIKLKEVGPLTVQYEGRTFSLRITAQTLKDPVSDTLEGYVFSLNVLS